jgi:coenzyme PQQ biosynthesis protein PqqD
MKPTVKPTVKSTVRPRLAAHVRSRYDARRGQHQLVYPEGLLVLGHSAAAIAGLCDGRTPAQILEALRAEYGDVPERDVDDFLAALAERGLLRDESA